MKKTKVDDRIVIPKLHKRSSAKWISTKDFLPDEPNNYLCITEREMTLGNIQRNGKTFGNCYEVCFFNNLMEAWQDRTLEVIVVTHWLPIPKLPI
jgi:hypothetical protein